LSVERAQGSDVVMHDMNGRQLAEALRATRPQMKVLYTSGYTANVIVHHGVLDSGIHFIGKPYAAQNLAAKVRGILDVA
jgi:two-component system, cell cycle sensor histidine kinase and response regulator CckA